MNLVTAQKQHNIRARPQTTPRFSGSGINEMYVLDLFVLRHRLVFWRVRHILFKCNSLQDFVVPLERRVRILARIVYRLWELQLLKNSPHFSDELIGSPDRIGQVWKLSNVICVGKRIQPEALGNHLATRVLINSLSRRDLCARCAMQLPSFCP
jgi:hypothetical protein